MQQISITEFSNNVAKHFNYVETERKGLVVTQDNHESCVFVPLSTWEGMNETLYLLSNEANAKHLRKSMQSAKEGKLVELVL